jgi:hypothetical protein
MPNPDPECKNCGGSGWVGYEIPSNEVDGVIYMRQQINPCHLCSAPTWPQWATKVATNNYVIRETLMSRKDFEEQYGNLC